MNNQYTKNITFEQQKNKYQEMKKVNITIKPKKQGQKKSKHHNEK